MVRYENLEKETKNVEYLPDLDNLIGQKINSVVVSDDKELIIFETDTHTYIYNAEADCCSHSWIEYVEDIDNVIGQTITKIEEKDISRGEGGGHECLDVMNYDLYTEKGICKIDFRNSSNGFYGGNLEIYKIIEKEKLC
jgi:hypothetical protein